MYDVTQLGDPQMISFEKQDNSVVFVKFGVMLQSIVRCITQQQTRTWHGLQCKEDTILYMLISLTPVKVFNNIC